MINYNESFLKNLEFSNVENKITGGYVYKGDSKQSDVYGGYVYKGDSKQSDVYGGSLKRDIIVPVGLVVNDYDDNMKCPVGEYIGVIGMNRINELLDLNHKPLKQITRKITSTIKANLTKKGNR